MTEASVKALTGIRDLSGLQWYVIPLLALVIYVYVSEIRNAKKTGVWDGVIAGITLFGADFLNETINGWILALSGRSALWTAPGPTALRVMAGWNIEIIFMFAIVGIIYFRTADDRNEKILKLPARWVWAIIYTAFCVFVETLLNKGDLLVWEYPFWNRTFGGIWLILIFGYFWFFAVTKFAMERKTIKGKLLVPAVIYTLAILLNIIGMGFLHMTY